MDGHILAFIVKPFAAAAILGGWWLLARACDDWLPRRLPDNKVTRFLFKRID